MDHTRFEDPDATEDIYGMKAATAPLVCLEPLRLLGVQNATPVAWSTDGMRFAFVSGNMSIFIMKRREWPRDPSNPKAGMASDYTLEHSLPGHTFAVKCLSFHPNNANVIVSGGLDGLFVWDITTRSLISKIDTTTRGGDAHEGDVECLCWTHGGATLVTGSKDTDIKAWDAMDGSYRLLETLNGHKATVLAISFNEETERLASGGRDSIIKIWNAAALNPDNRAKRADDKGYVISLEGNMDGQRGDICSITWFNNGKLLIAGARDNSIMMYDTIGLTGLRNVIADGPHGRHFGDIRRLLIHHTVAPAPPVTYLFSAGLDSKFKAWRLNLPEELVAAEMNAAEEEADTKLREEAMLASFLTSSADEVLSSVIVKDSLLASHEFHMPDGIAFLELNKAQKCIATASTESSVQIRSFTNFTSPTLMQEFVGHTSNVSDVAVLPGNTTLVSVSEDFSVHVYDMNSMMRLLKFDFESSCLCVTIAAPAGGTTPWICVGGSDYTIKIYAGVRAYYAPLEEAARARGLVPPIHTYEVSRFTGHSGKVRAVAASPDGNFIASGAEDFKIKLWEINAEFGGLDVDRPEGRVPRADAVQTIDAHCGHVTTIAFTPTATSSGVYLVSAANDHSLALWKLSGGKLRAHWKQEQAHEIVISAVCFGIGESSEWFFSAGWDGLIKVWSLSKRGGALLYSVKAADTRITSLSVNQKGTHLISTCANGIVSAFAINTAAGGADALRPDCDYPCNGESIGSLAAGGQSFIAGSETGMIRVFPLPNINPSLDRYFAAKEVLSGAGYGSMGAAEEKSNKKY